MKQESRSPLKARPRRLPGQSVEEHLWDGALEDILFPIFVAVLLGGAAGLEWYRVLVPSPPRPWAMTFVAVCGVAYSGFKLWRNVPRLRQLKLARDGERAVAEMLDILRESGYKVFHDLIGTGFNVDHVLIGPTGVYTIETKTYRKPARGEPLIEFDGETVTVGGWHPDRDPIAQARAQARWLREVLRESTGHDVWVRPVVVYPGWFVRKTRNSASDVWVLNPKALSSFIANEPQSLVAEDQRLLAFHLSRVSRAGSPAL